LHAAPGTGAGAGLRDDGGALQRAAPSRTAAVAAGARKAWFGDKHGWLDTPVLSRADLSASRAGPLIIEEYDATLLIPPGWRAQLDTHRNVLMDECAAADAPPDQGDAHA